MSDLEKSIKNLGKQLQDVVEKAISVEDVRMKRTSSLEFMKGDTSLSGKGMFWKDDAGTKQIVFRNNPDRFFASETIDVANEKSFSIGNVPVLSQNELGSTVTKSNLTKVGNLQNLHTNGDLVVDEFIYFASDSNRLGIGTDSPNASLSVTGLDSEFIVDVEGSNTRIGNWTTDDLEIITDDTTRIKVSATGKITIGSDSNSQTTVNGVVGINVNNPSNDADLHVANGIRFDGTKFETGTNSPNNGSYKQGDIVWNSEPKPTGYVGWICVRSGTPGTWKPFGQISS